MTFFPKNNITHSLPVGSLISINQLLDHDSIVNSNFWKPCDGACGLTIRYPDGTYYCGACNNFDIPLINDDVFLMGSSESTISSGGSNNLSDHKHCTDGTNLVADGQTFSGNSTQVCTELPASHTHSWGFSSQYSCQDSRNHCHMQNMTYYKPGSGVYCRTDCYNWTKPTCYTQGITTYTNTGSHDHCINFGNATLDLVGSHTHTFSISHLHADTCVTGTIGEGSNVPTSTEGRPRYSSSCFYLKVK